MIISEIKNKQNTKKLPHGLRPVYIGRDVDDANDTNEHLILRI